MQQRNPSHPAALTINQLRRGTQIVRFNRQLGVMLKGTIVREPYVIPAIEDMGPNLVVDIRSNYGFTQMAYITDMGIIPYEGGYWNMVNFTVKEKHSSGLTSYLTTNPYGDTTFEDGWWDDDGAWSPCEEYA